jgi:hypothetical protein
VRAISNLVAALNLVQGSQVPISRRADFGVQKLTGNEPRSVQRLGDTLSSVIAAIRAVRDRQPHIAVLRRRGPPLQLSRALLDSDILVLAVIT